MKINELIMLHSILSRGGLQTADRAILDRRGNVMANIQKLPTSIIAYERIVVGVCILDVLESMTIQLDS